MGAWAISRSMGGRGVPPPDYHDELLASARQLIDAGHSQAAVLVAQMACEVFIAQLLVALMEAKGLKEAAAWAEAQRGGFSFVNSETRALYRSLSGEKIQDTFAQWKDYKDHVELRNRVAHRGEKVSKRKAEEVCVVVEALTPHLRRPAEKRN